MGIFILTCTRVYTIMLMLVILGAVVSLVDSARVPFIVNGDFVREPGTYPYQASLQYSDYGDWTHTCGASVISSRWLITASHCIHANEKYSVLLGAYDIHTQKQGAPRRYNIGKIIMHPAYDPANSHRNDLALILLDCEAELNEYVKPIKLAEKGEDYEGARCTLSGWGYMQSGIPPMFQETPNYLRYVQTIVRDTEYCRKWVTHYSPAHLCTFRDGISACGGDSGGPLACEVDGEMRLVGTASFGFNSCSTTRPTVFATISELRDW